MSACDEFEVAIEKRRRGALDDREASALEAHLALCESCRRYDSTANKVGDAMQIAADAVVGRMDWDRVAARVQGIIGGYRRATRRMAFFAVPLLLLSLAAWGWAIALFWAAAWLAVIGANAWVTRARAREAVRAAATREDLLAFYRGEVDRRLQTNRRAIKLLVVTCALWVVGAIVGVLVFRTGFDGAFGSAVGAVSATACLAWYRRFVVVPRIERERAELSEK